MREVSVRQSQKAATRDRVVAAARDLFMSIGYEGSTVRQIATLAGVSVGTVFTHFASKGEILSEVMQERVALLANKVGDAWATEGTTFERLRAFFEVQFRFEYAHIKLFLAHIGATYDWTLRGDARPYGRMPRLQVQLIECLKAGQACGELNPDLDVGAIVDLLLGAYAWCYSLAAREDAGVEVLIAAMNRHLDIIITGLLRRP